MSTITWTSELEARWRTLRDWPLDDAQRGIDLVPGLMRLHGWSREQTRAAIAEYRRFLLLACALGPPAVAPSEAVDAVWHAHLLHSRSYFEDFCPQALGWVLHHAPARGTPGEAARLAEAYAQTLHAYETLFGPPPVALWPDISERMRQASRARVVDLDRVWLLPRPNLRRVSVGAARAFAIGAIALLGSGAAQAALGPLDWRGPEFLKLYLTLWLPALLLGLWLRRRARDLGPARGCADGPLETAVLAGGEMRAFDAASAELLAKDVLRIDAGGRLRRGAAELPDDPQLRALAVLAEREGDPGSLLKQATPQFHSLRGRLQQRGLVLERSQAWRARWRSALPLLALLGFGIAKIGIGLERERPVALLVLLCVLTALAALVLLMKSPARSLAGDAELTRLRGQHATRLRAPRKQDLGLAVALLGTAVLSTTAFAAYHSARHPPGSGDSSGGSDSSSSGDGGGSGCGGCGGD
jgi:uncharacterized protein (TIGR04222 family)